jgi:formate/nitrite transporter
MAFKSPAEVVETMGAACVVKTGLPWRKLLVSGFLAGAYIALGGLLAIVIGKGIAPTVVGDVRYSGLGRLLFAAVFPVGLMLVVVAGAELFTGNTAILVPGVLAGRSPLRGLVRNWTLSYIGNFAGGVFVAYALSYLAGLCAAEPYLSAVRAMAVDKTNLSFMAAFWRGVGCNWLVCLAVWMACSAEDVAGKILAVWFPIMAFVGLGFEHSVANMFFIPNGMLYGAEVSVGRFLVRNLLPVTLGNIVGGAFFVGVISWWLYRRPAAKPQ